ncbi:MAG TPA: thioredoxin family protein [Segetibacter sp.]
MKKLLVSAIVLATFAACSSTKQSSVVNTKFSTEKDGADKVLKGYITRSTIESDTAFKWFAENMKYGTADANAVAAFKKNGAKFSMIVFGGTWCHDTQNLLPVFYRLVEKSGYPESKITLIAVDRAKTGPDNLHKTYSITNVPTFIVLKEGKEVGRVVEYGKEGQIDKELGNIVTSAFQ